MDLLLFNPNTQRCFSALGVWVGATYQPSENCLDLLKEINCKLLSEDKVTRNFRRAIHFSQGLEKDIIPLLLETKDNEIIEAIIKLLASLLVPVECLIPLDVIPQTKNGQIVLFELQAFLSKTKTSFRDPRTTTVILQLMRSIILINEQNHTFSKDACETINNCLLVLRNILHIPDGHKNLQNIIVWNLFVQNIDEILLHLMTRENKEYWSVATVQLIAVLYKDQHVAALKKQLHIWFERSLSESSEDNESNTTPQDPRSTSSPMMTSPEPTSDSSDTSGKPENERNSPPNQRFSQPGSTYDCELSTGKSNNSDGLVRTKNYDANAFETSSELNSPWVGANYDSSSGNGHSGSSKASSKQHTCSHSRIKAAHLQTKLQQSLDDMKQCENLSNQVFSDYGYSSHLHTPETVSTSSNEEESSPPKRMFHQKPHIQKTRYSSKQLDDNKQEKKEARRKTELKRRKNTLKNKKAFANQNPRNEDIAHLLAEFTVDFLTTGFEPLVSALFSELLVPSCGVPLDTSHFLWLLTYFLKFTGQLQLNMDQFRGALSFRVLSYLVFEGVTITEQVEQLAENDSDMKSLLRRQHLVVTAIREFILSLEAFEKVSYLSVQEKQELRELHSMLSSSSDLKYLFVLLLRLYRPDVQNREYLEDLIITNHVLMIFLERQAAPANGEFIKEHLKQFATIDVMKNYGLILENFQSNGEFLNDCVFTMMHHIGGEVNQVACLCQPNILKSFTKIWESDVQLCEDWSDLIEYVMHRFVSFPTSQLFAAEESSKEFPKSYGVLNVSSSGNDFIAEIVKYYDENRSIPVDSGVPECDRRVSIGTLREKLVSDGFGDQLLWLQRFLLDTRLVKLSMSEPSSLGRENSFHPISYYCSLTARPIPLVPWDCDLARALRNRLFRTFLIQLGFQPPVGKEYFRIPLFWTADDYLICAQKLGKSDLALLNPLKGSVYGEVDTFTITPFIMPNAKNTTSMVTQTPSPTLATNWLEVVNLSKSAAHIEIGKIDSISYGNAVEEKLSVENTKNVEFTVGVEQYADVTTENMGCATNVINCGVAADVKDVNCAVAVKDIAVGMRDADDVEYASVASVCNTCTCMCISDEDEADCVPVPNEEPW